ncbi:MAG TPA: ABC transporter ATP-binding protein, partial [Actinobacteria bacterium]|nr:ABC transporter ATP-binding protein [Actinomycetota bacterium]
MLTTLLWPTSGTILVNGHDPQVDEDEVKNSVGLVAGEDRSFYWRLTGRQNLEFFSALYGLTPGKTREKINSLLTEVHLLDAADNMFYSYSSGMKQKLSLARGLLCDPAVLFLDEPTKSVDALTARDLRRFIKEGLRGKKSQTVFLTTHHLEEAELLCDRLAIIDKGKIVFCGTIADLRNVSTSKTKFEMTVDSLSKQKLEEICRHPSITALSIENSVSSESELIVGFSILNGHNPLPRVIEDVFSGGGSLLTCKQLDARLEEMFTALIEEQ